jgi:hypothetical protein
VMSPCEGGEEATLRRNGWWPPPLVLKGVPCEMCDLRRPVRRPGAVQGDAGGWQWRNSDGSIGLLTTVTTECVPTPRR